MPVWEKNVFYVRATELLATARCCMDHLLQGYPATGLAVCEDYPELRTPWPCCSDFAALDLLLSSVTCTSARPSKTTWFVTQIIGDVTRITRSSQQPSRPRASQLRNWIVDVDQQGAQADTATQAARHTNIGRCDVNHPDSDIGQVSG